MYIDRNGPFREVVWDHLLHMYICIDKEEWCKYVPIHIIDGIKSYKKDMIALFVAIYLGSGTSTKKHDLCNVRFLTGAHGLRPIRIRLCNYLVFNKTNYRKAIYEINRFLL